MKFNKESFIFILLLICCYSHNLKGSENITIDTNNPEFRTYLLKTHLTKEEIQTLIQEGETQVNLRKNQTHKNTILIEEVNTTTVENKTENTLEKQIEQEIKEDALHPIDEFHVDKKEVQTLINTPQARFIDKLYEKKFSRFYAYLTLFLFIFVMAYYKDSIFNPKNNYTKKPYSYNFDYNSEKEYMLVKNN